MSPLINGEDLPDLTNGRTRLEIVLTGEDAEERQSLLYREAKREKREPVKYLLHDHLGDVEAHAIGIAQKLVPVLEPTLAESGRKHDTGKSRDIWQRWMGRCRGRARRKVFLNSDSITNGRVPSRTRFRYGCAREWRTGPTFDWSASWTRPRSLSAAGGRCKKSRAQQKDDG